MAKKKTTRKSATIKAVEKKVEPIIGNNDTLNGEGNVLLGYPAGKSTNGTIGQVAGGLSQTSESDEIVEDVSSAVGETPKEIAIREVTEFFKLIGNRRVVNSFDLGRMFQWYREITSKDPGTTSCSACCTHVYNVLKLNAK